MKSFAPVVILFLALIAALISLVGDDSYPKMLALRKSLESQESQNEVLKMSVNNLRRQVHGLQTDNRVLEKAAREELMMSRPSEFTFVFEQDESYAERKNLDSIR